MLFGKSLGDRSITRLLLVSFLLTGGALVLAACTENPASAPTPGVATSTPDADGGPPTPEPSPTPEGSAGNSSPTAGRGSPTPEPSPTPDRTDVDPTPTTRTGSARPEPPPTPEVTFVVDSTADAPDAANDGVCDDGAGRCTLRAAIMQASVLDVVVSITLPRGVYKITIKPRSPERNSGSFGDLRIRGEITIIGAGKDSTIIDGGGLDRVFEILEGSTVRISGVTIQNGKAEPGSGETVGGGGIVNHGTLTLIDATVSENSGTIGGGIRNFGTLTLFDSTISDNQAKFGGGIANQGTLTLTGSTVTGNAAESNGGGIDIEEIGTVSVIDSAISDNAATRGGGIHNGDHSTLTLTRSTVTGNAAAGFGGGLDNTSLGWVIVADSTISDNLTARGGGIRSGNLRGGGTLIVTDSTVTGNFASEIGGGILNVFGDMKVIDSTVSDNSATSGGGVYNFVEGTLTLTGSVVTGNIAYGSGLADGGGGIRNASLMTVTKSTVSGNSAEGEGGGIYNTGDMLTLSGSTVSGNSADGVFGGGGIYNNDIMGIMNSTVSGNSATGFGGGGIFNSSDDAELDITNSTVSGNSTELSSGGGGINNLGGTTRLANTIVANSPSGGDCEGDGIISLGHNLDDDGTCNLTQPTDLPNTDPRLGPFQDNGGPTLTHSLLPGSPAIGTGDTTACRSGGSADQRGVARLQGSLCDIGATAYNFGFNPDEYGFLGVFHITLNSEMVQLMDLPDGLLGVLVFETVPEGPAEQAGIRGGDSIQRVGEYDIPLGGDVIIGIDGALIQSDDDLRAHFVLNTKPGDVVTVEVVRQGGVETLDVLLGSRPR